jgi:hypothetical protein
MVSDWETNKETTSIKLYGSIESKKQIFIQKDPKKFN